MSEPNADFVSFIAVVGLAARRLRDFPPDERSQDWAAAEPARAAAIAGVLIAATLSAYFFVTEDDAGEAAGASALACVVALVCAWMCRREYARRAGG